MKPKLLTALTVIAITGCSYQAINEYDLQEATTFCADKDGIAEISASFDGNEFVICNNNVKTALHQGK